MTQCSRAYPARPAAAQIRFVQAVKVPNGTRRLSSQSPRLHRMHPDRRLGFDSIADPAAPHDAADHPLVPERGPRESPTRQACAPNRVAGHRDIRRERQLSPDPIPVCPGGAAEAATRIRIRRTASAQATACPAWIPNLSNDNGSRDASQGAEQSRSAAPATRAKRAATRDCLPAAGPTLLTSAGRPHRRNLDRIEGPLTRGPESGRRRRCPLGFDGTAKPLRSF